VTILIFAVFKEFEDILARQVCLDNLVQWFEMVVDRCVVTAVRKHGCPVRRVAHHFLLIWVTVGTRVLRDMTIFSAHSFGESSSHSLDQVYFTNRVRDADM